MTTVQQKPEESREIPTLVVPDDIYDEALTFCNARRAEKGLEPITKLPAGKPLAHSCPCSKTCTGLWVHRQYWAWYEYRGGNLLKSEDMVYAGTPERFISFFDNGCEDEESLRDVDVLPVRASLAGGAS